MLGALLLLASGQEARVEPFTFAVLSDPHVGARGSAENLERFVEEGNRLGVAFTIACGDLTEVGSAGEWERFASISKGLKAPFHPILGNHDARWAPDGKRPLARHLGISRPYRSFDHGGVRFALLDSSILGEAHGGIDRAQLGWLDADLAGRPAGSPAVVALHHHPFPGGGKRFLANEEALLEILRARGARLVLAGHGHDLRRWSVGGVEILMTPNLYAEKARWRRIRVEADRFVVENRSLGSEGTDEEEPIPFRAPEGVGAVPAPMEVAPGEWNVETPATSLRAVAVSGERAYLAGTEGVLAVHSLATGALLKTLPLEAPAHASPVVAGDRVIVASEGGTVTALRPTDLSTIWEARLGGAVVMTPGVDGHRLFVGSGDGRLHALSLVDGRALWSFEGERHFGSPAAANDRVFAGNWDGHVYALAAPDGRLLWKRKVHDSFYFAPGTSRPAPAGDLVVVAFAVPTRPSDAPSVLALRADTGEVAWSMRIPAGYASPLVVEDRVYFATTEGEVVAVERATGEVLWERDLGAPCYDASPVLVSGGIAVGTVDGELAFLDFEGGVRHRFQAARPWLFATPVVVGERLVLPDAFGRSLACFRVPR